MAKNKIKYGNVELPEYLPSNFKVEFADPKKFRSILKILRSKDLKAREFKRDGGKISFSTEIDAEPDNPKDWQLQILVVPDLAEPDHDHYFFNEKEMRSIQKA